MNAADPAPPGLPPPRRRRRLRLAAALVALAIVTALGGTCSSARFPPPESLAQPCTAYLLQTPIHPVLALPDGRGGYVGFGFGDECFMGTFDWRQYPWGAWLVFAGLPGELTRGAMERVVYRGTTRDDLARESGMEVDEFRVERARAEALRRRLESKVGRAVGGYDWLFETDDRYSLWWDNCHSAIAAWLRELGAEVPRLRLLPRFTGWTVRQ
jgi:hypothetical protein